MSAAAADRPVVVVGGGMAGGRAAEFLAVRGRLGGRVVVVGGEPDRPYHRPPLSKGLLTRESEPGSAFFRDASFYAGRGIELRLGVRAAALDPDSGAVVLDSGGELAYSAVILAPGTVPRRLRVPGSDLSGVHVLRTLADAVAVRDRLATATQAVIVGGGFVGMEVAAACVHLGVGATVVEAAPAPLAGVLGVEVGRMLQRSHERRGVRFRTERGVERIVGRDGVDAVVLAGGEVLPADIVIVGIGVVPDVGWLAGSGVLGRDGGDGITVDERCRTRVPGVFAAGDAARWEHAGFGGIRLEHETNAQNQAMVAARNVLGQAAAHRPLPYVWSDQGELKIRYVGHATEWDDVLISAGRTADGFTAAYCERGSVRAVLSVNEPERLSRAEELLRAGPFPANRWQGHRASA